MTEKKLTRYWMEVELWKLMPNWQRLGLGKEGFWKWILLKNKDWKERKDLDSITNKGTDSGNVWQKWQNKSTIQLMKLVYPLVSSSLAFLPIALALTPCLWGWRTTLLPEISIPWLAGSTELSLSLPKKLSVWQQLIAKINSCFLQLLVFSSQVKVIEVGRGSSVF